MIAVSPFAFSASPIQWLREFQDYVRGLGALGYVVYTLGYGVIGTFFPASILTIGAGALFGVVAGSIVVVIGATIAATIAFILARTILRKRVEAMAAGNPKLQAPWIARSRVKELSRS